MGLQGKNGIMGSVPDYTVLEIGITEISFGILPSQIVAILLRFLTSGKYARTCCAHYCHGRNPRFF